MTIMIHGSVVQYKGIGILCLGSPGSGKSDLILRLMSKGGKLVADDQVILTADAVKKTNQSHMEQLFACAPDGIQGKLEIRGLGIYDFPFLQQCSIAVILNLVKRNQIERLPFRKNEEFLTVSVPCFNFCSFDISWCEKLEIILDNL